MLMLIIALATVVHNSKTQRHFTKHDNISKNTTTIEETQEHRKQQMLCFVKWGGAFWIVVVFFLWLLGFVKCRVLYNS